MVFWLVINLVGCCYVVAIVFWLVTNLVECCYVVAMVFWLAANLVGCFDVVAIVLWLVADLVGCCIVKYTRWPILEIGALHLTHPSAHTQQWTHTLWTRTRSSGQPLPGEQLGVQCLAQGHLSHGIEGGESAVHSQSPPSIPAGPEIWTCNLVTIIVKGLCYVVAMVSCMVARVLLCNCYCSSTVCLCDCYCGSRALLCGCYSVLVGYYGVLGGC